MTQVDIASISFGMIVSAMIAVLWLTTPLKFQLVGNGHQLANSVQHVGDGIATALTDLRADGDIFCSVDETGRYLTLHAQVEAVDDQGRLLLKHRVRPGSWGVLVAPGRVSNA